jgi:hypothetical protein
MGEADWLTLGLQARAAYGQDAARDSEQKNG